MFEFFDGGSGEGEVIFEEEGDLIAEDAAEDKDRGGDAVLAEEDAFFEEGDAEVGDVQGGEVASDLDEAVTVGVGFEDGHDGGRGDGLLDGLVVGGEAAEVYLDVGGAED